MFSVACKKVVGGLVLSLSMLALVAGCQQPVGDEQPEGPANPAGAGGAQGTGGLPAPNGPKEGEKVLMTRTCGSEGDHMAVSFTSDRASTCGERVMVNGISVKGLRAYNEQDKRWTLGFNIPEGATSGDVVVWGCHGGEVLLGRLQIPCAPPDETGNAFSALGGALTVAAGCDDDDRTVTLSGFTKDSFVMTGLAENGPITFTVNGTSAEAVGVVQYGLGGHKVKLAIDTSNQRIRFDASSADGSCSTTLTKR